MALGPLVYIIGIGDIIRTQYMIPNGMDRQYTTSIICSAIINLILSILLIPYIGIYGVVVGAIAAELFGLVYQIIICNKFIKISEIYNTAIPTIIIGTIMLVIIKIVSNFLPFNVYGLLIELLIGVTVFGSLTLLYILLFEKEIIQLCLGRIRR